LVVLLSIVTLAPNHTLCFTIRYLKDYILNIRLDNTLYKRTNYLPTSTAAAFAGLALPVQLIPSI
jgi:hypothetical protein